MQHENIKQIQAITQKEKHSFTINNIHNEDKFILGQFLYTMHNLKIGFDGVFFLLKIDPKRSCHFLYCFLNSALDSKHQSTGYFW